MDFRMLLCFYEEHHWYFDRNCIESIDSLGNISTRPFFFKFIKIHCFPTYFFSLISLFPSGIHYFCKWVAPWGLHKDTPRHQILSTKETCHLKGTSRGEEQLPLASAKTDSKWHQQQVFYSGVHLEEEKKSVQG